MSPLELNQETNSSFTPYPSSLCHCGFMLRCIESPPDQSAEKGIPSRDHSTSPPTLISSLCHFLNPALSPELISCTRAATHMLAQTLTLSATHSLTHSLNGTHPHSPVQSELHTLAPSLTITTTPSLPRSPSLHTLTHHHYTPALTSLHTHSLTHPAPHDVPQHRHRRVSLHSQRAGVRP